MKVYYLKQPLMSANIGMMPQPLSAFDCRIVFCLALASLLIHGWLEFRWAGLGTFAQFNVIFDTDPNTHLNNFAHGWETGGFNHPLLSYYFSIPLRLLELALRVTGLSSEPIVTRSHLALGVVPFMSALRVAGLYLAVRWLALRPADALLITLIGMLAFGALVFGATPSSYAVSAAGIALVIAFSQYRREGPGWLQDVPLWTAAAFAIGTTSSNVIFFGWFLWARRTAATNRPVSEFVKALYKSAILLICVVGLSAALATVRGDQLTRSYFAPPSEHVAAYRQSFDEQLVAMARLPEFLARSFIPTLPERQPNRLAIQNDNPIRFELTYGPASFGLGAWLLWVTGVMILSGVWAGARLSGPWRLVTLASLGAILTAGAVFTLFGKNTFLFSVYWQVPAVFLVGAWIAYLLKVCPRPGRVLVAITGAALGVANALVLWQIDKWIIEGVL